jgi:serralysin
MSLFTTSLTTTFVQPIAHLTYYIGDTEDFFNPVASRPAEAHLHTISTANSPDGQFLGRNYEGFWAVTGDARDNNIALGVANNSSHNALLANTVNAGAGNDTITGNNGIDAIQGGYGNDLIYGMGGMDILFGGIGNDVIYGGYANDTLRDPSYWASGRDAADLGDFMFGGAGNDLLIGGTGSDFIDGGSGNDTASYFNSESGIWANLATGKATYGPFEDTLADFEDSFTDIENLIGSDHADWLAGNAGNNILYGLNGNDMLWGAGGSDSIVGGAGNDAIYGGAAADRLNGGTGNDRFEYMAATDSGPAAGTRDTIFFFEAGDRIDLSFVDANETAGMDQAFRLDTGGAFLPGEIQQQRIGTGILLTMNTDANASAEMSIWLGNRSAFVTAADFIL